MSRYYFVHWLDDDGPVAYGPDDPERDGLVQEPGRVEQWLVPALHVTGGAPTDYLANSIGVRLCSARLRDVIESCRGEDDQIQWLSAEVFDSSGARHEYQVLHFVDLPDVLDAKRTILVDPNFVVKPVVSRRKCLGRHVLAFPGADIRWIVSEVVRESVVASGCTGMEFSEVASSD